VLTILTILKLNFVIRFHPFPSKKQAKGIKRRLNTDKLLLSGKFVSILERTQTIGSSTVFPDSTLTS